MKALIHTSFMLVAWPFLIVYMTISVSLAVAVSIAKVWVQR